VSTKMFGLLFITLPLPPTFTWMDTTLLHMLHTRLNSVTVLHLFIVIS